MTRRGDRPVDRGASARGSLRVPVLTAKGACFATGKAIFRGYHFGAPASCCIFGHIRHNWAEATR